MKWFLVVIIALLSSGCGSDSGSVDKIDLSRKFVDGTTIASMRVDNDVGRGVAVWEEKDNGVRKCDIFLLTPEEEKTLLERWDYARWKEAARVLGMPVELLSRMWVQGHEVEHCFSGHYHDDQGNTISSIDHDF